MAGGGGEHINYINYNISINKKHYNTKQVHFLIKKKNHHRPQPNHIYSETLILINKYRNIPIYVPDEVELIPAGKLK